MMNPNLKLDFGYISCKGPRIVNVNCKRPKKLEKVDSSCYMTNTHIVIFLTKIGICSNLSTLNPILKLFLTYKYTLCFKSSLKMIKNQQILFFKLLINSQNGLKCYFWFIVEIGCFLDVSWVFVPNLAWTY